MMFGASFRNKRAIVLNMGVLPAGWQLFKASALWAAAFYKSKCPYVCVCVCVCVGLFVHFLRYCLNVFLPPFPEVGCPILFDIRNPWGKVMERSGLRFEHSFWKWSKIAKQKNSFFLMILPYKTWWKPRFPMD